MCKIYTKEESMPLEERLSKFCKENSITFTNNTNITNVCNKLNISTVAMPLDDEKLDGLILIDKDIRVIATNKTLDVHDSRFVIAHELAHYISKSSQNKDRELLFAEKDRVFHGGAKKPEENDMDYLAAAMLVPKEQFIDELFVLKVDIKNLTDKTEKGVRRFVHPKILSFMAYRYNVKEDVIARRIAEVSYYA